MSDLVTPPIPRDTQFAGFAKALFDELPDVPDGLGVDEWSTACEQAIARRAYDLVEHTVGYCLGYLHECGFELSGTMNSRIQPSIPDMTACSEVSHG